MKFNISNVFLLSFLITICACQKWDLDTVEFPAISTGAFEFGAQPSEVTLFGEISDLSENAFVSNHGHVWSLDANTPPTVENSEGQTLFAKIGNGTYQSLIDGLTPGKTYYYRAYIIFNNEVVYADETKSFNAELILPEFVIDSIKRISDNEINVFANISNLPLGLPLKSYGFAWGTNEFPDIESASFFPQQGLIVSTNKIEYQTTIQLAVGDNYLRPFLVVEDEVFYGSSTPYRLFDLWVRKRSFPGINRSQAIAFSIDNKGYLGTGNGEDAISNELMDFWEYNPSTNAWTQRVSFSGGRIKDAVAFSNGSRAFVTTGIAGFNAPVAKDLWEYEANMNRWVRRGFFPGSPRSGAVAFTIADKAYVGGGEYFQREMTDDFWEYDMNAGTWSQKAKIPGEPRDDAFGFASTSKGYVGAGRDSSFQALTDFWEYDPLNDNWVRKADYIGATSGSPVGLAIEDRSFVIDGNDLWEYILVENSWHQLRSINQQSTRFEPVGFSLNSKLYYGIANSIFDDKTDWWEYIPE